MLSTEQKISLLSDTVLYPEAVALIRRLVRDEDYAPLPASQVAGLLNVTASASYSELYRFVVHQRDRNWPDSKSNIKALYTELEKYLTDMRKRRLKDEFHLVTDGLPVKEANLEADTVMARLTREYIQHLLAENGFLASTATAGRGQRNR